MNVEIGTETPIFLFWEYLFQICSVASAQGLGYSRFQHSQGFISIFQPRRGEMLSRQGFDSLDGHWLPIGDMKPFQWKVLGFPLLELEPSWFA
jgi:hypothetical protein